MRVLIVLVILIAIAVGLGWVIFDRSSESIDIRINTQKVEDDADRLIEGAKDALKPKEDTTAEPAPVTAN